MTKHSRILFFTIICSLAIYRVVSCSLIFKKEYSIDSSIDFRNVYLGSFNLLKNINPYNDLELKNSWKKITKSLNFNTIDFPGNPDQPFIYPPWASVVFIPLAVLPYNISIILWYAMLLCSYLALSYVLPKAFFKESTSRTTIEILLLLLAFKVTKGSFIVGQPAYLIFLVSIFSVWSYNCKNYLLAGFFLGLSTFKISIALPFYFFFLSKIIHQYLSQKTIDKNSLKTVLTSISFTLFCLFSESAILNLSPLQRLLDYVALVSEFKNMYCLKEHESYFILSGCTEFIVFLKYFLGSKVCEFSWIGTLFMFVPFLFLYFNKNYKTWSDMRLLLALSLGNLLSTYHQYYDCICFALFYIIWSEMPKWAQQSILSLLIFDLLISTEKTLCIFNMQSEILNTINYFDLPLRILLMLFVVCTYKQQKASAR